MIRKVTVVQYSVNWSHSLTHWTAWPARGRSAFQTSRSVAAFHAVSAAISSSSTTWWTHVFFGHPRSCLHPGLPSTRRPDRASMDRLSAVCAGVVNEIRRTGPNTANHHLRIFVWRDSLDVCGQSLQRSSQNRTSVSQECGADSTCGRPQASDHQISDSSMFRRHTVGPTWRERVVETHHSAETPLWLSPHIGQAAHHVRGNADQSEYLNGWDIQTMNDIKQASLICHYIGICSLKKCLSFIHILPAGRFVEIAWCVIVVYIFFSRDVWCSAHRVR